ncbi:unnamed protein product [Euphydryas editha]|uniref:Uncharacterized protein n=1 Tax=Euphydryas editha TaxID=104508 RepID=A0AAU9VAN3_EUPED|nr:unnamed protein product [Euphydryas editha]
MSVSSSQTSPCMILQPKVPITPNDTSQERNNTRKRPLSTTSPSSALDPREPKKLAKDSAWTEVSRKRNINKNSATQRLQQVKVESHKQMVASTPKTVIEKRGGKSHEQRLYSSNKLKDVLMRISSRRLKTK